MSTKKFNQQNKILVIVIGGGFGGLAAIKRLAKVDAIEILLIDSNNYHCFQPLLYQVATAGLNPGDISISFRSIFLNDPNISILNAEVFKIDLDMQEVYFEQQKRKFDYVIFSTGAEPNYFNHPEWKVNVLELKSVDDAIKIRNTLLKIFEKKELINDKDIQIGIIGGGATGIELAGSIAEFCHFTAKNGFRNIKPNKTKIYLFEKSHNILASFGERLSGKATEYLKQLGITVMTDSNILEIQAHHILLENNSFELDMIIWTAGVKARSGIFVPELERDQSQRIFVTDDLSIKGYRNSFVIGDQANSHVTPFPAIAPLAMQQGRQVAKNIIADQANRPRSAFQYKDKGSMAVIGRKYAVAHLAGFKFSGLLAWLIWCFAHISPLIGFRSKIIVLFEFLWSYLHYKKGVRIITKFIFLIFLTLN